MAPVLRLVEDRALAAKRGWRPKAGLADRNTGTGEPEGSPTRAALNLDWHRC